MARSYPPDVIVLDSDSLLHARLARGKRDPRIAQAKSFRLPADTFASAMVTPELANEAGLADTIRRVKNETGRWEKLSLLLPDSWFRINILELPAFNERAADAKDVVRWSLKRTLPIPPEELRVAYSVLTRNTNGSVKLLVVSAMEKTLARIERLFADAGIETILIEPIGLNLWNAISVHEKNVGSDRLFLYVRDREFTTAVFRGEEPVFIRSRNLSAERSLQQEIRLSASYLRDALRTEKFDQCYIAGNGAGEAAATLSFEFDSPVATIDLRDFAEEGPSYLTGYDAELTACTGVFTG